MPNNYLKSKIRNYELYKGGIVFILIICAFFAGKYLFFDGPLNIIVGLVLGTFGGATLLVIEHCVNKQSSYDKGLKLEEQIAEKLEKLDIKHEPHVETDYGDLDFLIEKDSLCYGVEAKNWPGNVIFENGLLKVNGLDNTDILSTLLKHCKLVRNLKFGDSSGKFIKPMLVFGYKAVISVPQNKIMFNNVEIIIATIKDFDRHIK